MQASLLILIQMNQEKHRKLNAFLNVSFAMSLTSRAPRWPPDVLKHCWQGQRSCTTASYRGNCITALLSLSPSQERTHQQSISRKFLKDMLHSYYASLVDQVSHFTRSENHSHEYPSHRTSERKIILAHEN